MSRICLTPFVTTQHAATVFTHCNFQGVRTPVGRIMATLHCIRTAAVRTTRGSPAGVPYMLVSINKFNWALRFYMDRWCSGRTVEPCRVLAT